MQSLIQVATGFQVRPEHGWGWLLFSGVTGLILGGLIWAQGPAGAVWLLDVWFGLNLLSDGMGSLSGLFRDYGIDDDFIGSVHEQVTEGTSALFLLTGSVTLDKVEEEMKGQIGTLIKSNLTHEQEAKLNAGFVEE